MPCVACLSPACGEGPWRCNLHIRAFAHARHALLTLDTMSLHTTSKDAFYAQLAKEAAGLFEGEKDAIANCSNLSALLYHELNKRSGHEAVNWAGFYFMKNNELVLGPFQGVPASASQC